MNALGPGHPQDAAARCSRQGKYRLAKTLMPRLSSKSPATTCNSMACLFTDLYFQSCAYHVLPALRRAVIILVVFCAVPRL